MRFLMICVALFLSVVLVKAGWDMLVTDEDDTGFIVLVFGVGLVLLNVTALFKKPEPPAVGIVMISGKQNRDNRVGAFAKLLAGIFIVAPLAGYGCMVLWTLFVTDGTVTQEAEGAGIAAGLFFAFIALISYIKR